MPDITMCKGVDCPLRETCHRHMVTPSEHRQSYFFISPVEILDDSEVACRFYSVYKTKTTALSKALERRDMLLKSIECLDVELFKKNRAALEGMSNMYLQAILGTTHRTRLGALKVSLGAPNNFKKGT
jgi:hypothetical protein